EGFRAAASTTWPRASSVGTARPLAVPLLALQREGALGARLEGHRARAPLAPARLPRPARPLDDGVLRRGARPARAARALPRAPAGDRVRGCRLHAGVRAGHATPLPRPLP